MTGRRVKASPLTRFRREIYQRIPEWVRKRDFELFTVLLCFTAGLPLLLTRKVDAASLEATLPLEVVIVWASVLVIAPLIVVFGAWRAHKMHGLIAFRWVRWEVFGLRMLSYAAYLYAAVIAINSLATRGSFPVAVTIIALFGLTCTSRAWGMLEQIEDFWERAGVHR